MTIPRHYYVDNAGNVYNLDGERTLDVTGNTNTPRPMRPRGLTDFTNMTSWMDVPQDRQENQDSMESKQIAIVCANCGGDELTRRTDDFVPRNQQPVTAFCDMTGFENTYGSHDSTNQESRDITGDIEQVRKLHDELVNEIRRQWESTAGISTLQRRVGIEWLDGHRDNFYKLLDEVVANRHQSAKAEEPVCCPTCGIPGLAAARETVARPDTVPGYFLWRHIDYKPKGKAMTFHQCEKGAAQEVTVCANCGSSQFAKYTDGMQPRVAEVLPRNRTCYFCGGRKICTVCPRCGTEAFQLRSHDRRSCDCCGFEQFGSGAAGGHIHYELHSPSSGPSCDGNGECIDDFDDEESVDLPTILVFSDGTIGGTRLVDGTTGREYIDICHALRAFFPEGFKQARVELAVVDHQVTFEDGNTVATGRSAA